MKKSAYLLLLGLLATSCHTVAVELKIDGISQKALLENIRLHLTQLSPEEVDGSERHQYRVQELADKGLRALGYYNSEYRFTLTPRSAPQADLLTLTISLKPPVKLGESDVDIFGEAKEDQDLARFIQRETPKQGTQLNHETYDNFKGSLDRLAQAKGYFDGEWRYSRLEVYPNDSIADWRLGYESGVRYRYGKINFINSQIRHEYLNNMLQIKAGDPYYINDLSRLSSDFSLSNWFSTVTVDPKIDEQNKRVNLDVLLQPKKRNEMEMGLGYTTDVGIRSQFTWRKPWFNSRGHSFELRSNLSKPEQNVELGYKIPLEKNPLYYYYQFSGSLDREDNNNTRSTAASLGFQRVWNHQTGWAFSLGLKTRYDAFEQGDDKFKTFLVYPTAGFNRTRSDGLRFPLWGDSQKLSLNWGSKAIGSDVNFYSAKFSSAWLRTYWDKHRVYLRGEVGYLHANAVSRMPPTLRYFAGGDMSIRGFGYKDISPRNAAGKLVGGTRLLTATAEYQYQVYPNWWAAVFYDTGLASYKFQRGELHSGAGLGVRWASPIGAVKLDIATPVRSPSNQRGIQFYIGLGAEL